MCTVSVFLELRISFFIDEGQGVSGDKVLLHPGDDTLAPQNPKIKIMIKLFLWLPKVPRWERLVPLYSLSVSAALDTTGTGTWTVPATHVGQIKNRKYLQYLQKSQNRRAY